MCVGKKVHRQNEGTEDGVSSGSAGRPRRNRHVPNATARAAPRFAGLQSIAGPLHVLLVMIVGKRREDVQARRQSMQGPIDAAQGPAHGPAISTAIDQLSDREDGEPFKVRRSPKIRRSPAQ